jgi:hypothetical protein
MLLFHGQEILVLPHADPLSEAEIGVIIFDYGI